MSKVGSKKNAFEYVDSDRNESVSSILKSVQIKFEAIDRRHQASLYKCMAVVFELRLRLNDEENWVEFCADERWEKRLERNRPKLKAATEKEKTHFVAVAAFAGKDEVRIDRASKYGSVIEYYRSENLVPSRLPDQLKKDGGIEVVLANLSGRTVEKLQSELLKALATKNNGGADVADDDSASDEDQEVLSDDDEETKPDTSEVDEQPKKQQRLGIDVNEKQLSKALDLPAGTKLRIEAIRVDGPGTWKGIKASKISLR